MISHEPADPSTAPANRSALIEARLQKRAHQQRVEHGVSQKVGKRVEERFDWTKTVAGLGKSRRVGRWKLQ
jgi:hypothetical protein